MTILRRIVWALDKMHKLNIVHKDLHSGNIFMSGLVGAVIGDLGISKSATESSNVNNENYGIRYSLYGSRDFSRTKIYRSFGYI